MTSDASSSVHVFATAWAGMPGSPTAAIPGSTRWDSRGLPRTTHRLASEALNESW